MAKTKRAKRGAVRGKVAFAPPLAPPKPGRWKPMQTFGELVCQWAWTCRHCETTEYVLVNPPAALEVGLERRERCHNPKCNNGGLRPWERVRVLDERTAAAWE